MQVSNVSSEELQSSYFINLPSPYFGLDYSKNNASTCFNTGVVLDVDDFEIEMRGSFSTGDWYILQSKEDANDPDTTYGLVGGPNGDEICGSVCGLTLTSSIQRVNNYDKYIRFTCKNGVATLFALDPYSNVSDTKTGTYTFTPATQPVGIFANIQNGERGNSSASNNAIKWFKIKKAGQVVFYGVFCYGTSDYKGYLYNLLTDQVSLPITGTLSFQTYYANQILIDGVFTHKQFITSVDCSDIPWKDNCMYQAFFGCDNLTHVSNISNSVTNLCAAFDATNISTIPSIPSSAIDMNQTFFSCNNLTCVPEIPNSVTNMSSTFGYCKNLTTSPVIPNSVINMSYTFKNCTNLTGDVYIQSSNVTNAMYCFNGTSLSKNVHVPANSTTYNTFIAAGYDDQGTKEGVTLIADL